MKGFILIIISTLILPGMTAQQLNLTIEGGLNLNFSNQIDRDLRPDFTVFSLGHQRGGSLLFSPRKSNLSFGTGLFIDKQSTATGLNRLLELTGFESVRPKRTHYNSIKIPIILEYNIGRETKGKRRFDWSGFVMFSQHRNQDDFQLNNGSQILVRQSGTKYDLNYWTYKTTFVYYTYSFESGFRLTFPLQEQINLTTSLSYKTGFHPVFTTYVEVDMEAQTGQGGGLNADFFNVNKGDAVLFNIGLRYDFHLKKKRD